MAPPGQHRGSYQGRYQPFGNRPHSRANPPYSQHNQPPPITDPSIPQFHPPFMPDRAFLGQHPPAPVQLPPM